MSADQLNKADTLRERAEELLAGSKGALDSTELTDLKKLAHELAVHQAELELQNEELRQTQLALQETRDRFAALYEYAPVGYVVLDSTGIIRQANHTWRVMVNRSDEDFRGSPFSDTIFPEDASIFLARFRTFFRNPAKKQIVVRMKRKGKAPFHAQIEAQPRVTKPDKHAGTGDELMISVGDITERKQAEDVLRESEHYLRSVVETSGDGFWAVDRQGIIVEVNDAYCTMSGYTREEILGMNIGDLDVHESPAETAARIKRIIAGGSERFETHHRRKDGSFWPVEISVSWLDDYGGRFVCFGRDLTGRRRREEDIALLGRMLDEAPAAITIHNNDGRFLYANHYTVRLHGYEDEKEFLAVNLRDLDVPESEALLDKRFRRIAETGEARFEVAHYRKDGSTFPLEVLAKAIQWEGQDAVLSIAADISDRVEAEEALMESEMFLQETQAAARLGGWKANPLTDALKWTDGVYDIIEAPRNYSPGLAEGLKYFCPEYLPAIREGLNRCRDEGQSFEMEAEIVTLKGNRRWVDLRGFSRRDGHNAPVIMGTIQDISDRKQAEGDRKKLRAQLQQAQKMEAVGTLAGGISHDFNNLLQAISGFTEMLLMGRPESDPGYRALKAIQNAGDRASDLIRQLLLFSRKAASAKKTIALQHSVEQAKKMLERTIPKMVEIQTITGNRLWTINADPVQIEQMLLNLGTNAADAMPDGGRLLFEIKNVTLDTDDTKGHLGAEPGRYVRLSASDTGHGMDRETMKKIFDPFFTTKAFGKGTGLGLASVYGIVKSHGGTITCDSEVGKGTTFRIYFPAMVQPKGGEIEEIEARPIPKGTETILLVDDEEAIRSFARQALMKFGYGVLTAATGEEALERYSAKSTEIDLVIMDLGMPGMGGHKCLEEMLKLNRQVRVIIASGYAINDQAEKSLAAGARGYVGKPYRLTELLNTVRKVLDGDSHLSAHQPEA
jgi:two-component system cell cycle sensor histidine kinase/response regulator CckA